MRAFVRRHILVLTATLVGFGALTLPAQSSDTELGDVVMAISTEVHSLQQHERELSKVFEDAEKSSSSGVSWGIPWAGQVCGRASMSLVSGVGLQISGHGPQIGETHHGASSLGIASADDSLGSAGDNGPTI